MELPSLLSLVLALSFFFFLKTFITKHKTQNPKPELPPGPPKLPIIGSIHHLAGELPHRRLRSLAEKYGPLLHVKLGEVGYVIASSSEAAREILQTHDVAFASRPALMIIKTIAYNCAGVGFSPYGPYWRQLRKLCAVELLSSRRVKSFAAVRQEQIKLLAQKIRAASAERSAVNLTDIFLGLTNDHLTRAAFGRECASRERFLVAMKETIKLAPVVSLMDLFPSLSFFISRVDGSMKKMKRLHKEMDEILDEIISEHKEKKRVQDREVEDDLIDVMLRIQEEGELEIPLGMIDVKAVILDLLVAATETTTSTMEWVMSELIKNPEAMYKAQLEVRQALGGKTVIEEKEIEGLQYLQRVIKETLRLHPPLPLLLPRTCSESVELLGFTVPSRSRVMINAWAIGRDPKVWEDAERFLPDRFQGNAADFRGGSFEYIPFGAGRRICPGMTFAMAGMELFLALLLLHFNWELPGGKNREELDMDEEFDGSLRRKNQLFLLAIPYI